MKRDTKRGVVREPSPRLGGLSFRATAARCALLFCAVLIASCARPEASGDSHARFGVVTSEGIVLAIVEGSAKGFTNEDLTRLIGAGVAEAYVIHCVMTSDLAATEGQMIWQVNNDGRKPTATITVHLVQGGRTVKSAFSNVAAPGSNPDAVFMYDVSHLAQRVLPPATKPIGSSRIGCS